MFTILVFSGSDGPFKWSYLLYLNQVESLTEEQIAGKRLSVKGISIIKHFKEAVFCSFMFVGLDTLYLFVSSNFVYCLITPFVKVYFDTHFGLLRLSNVNSTMPAT